MQGSRLNKNLNFVSEQQNFSQNQGPSCRNPGKFRSRTLKSDHISLTSLPYFFLKIRAKYDLRIYHIPSLLAGWPLPLPACSCLLLLHAKGALAVLTKLVWENMKTRCATSRQRLLSRLTTVERAWRPLVSDILTCDIQYIV